MVAPQVADEFGYVHGKEMSLQTVMDRLAKSVGGTWTKEGDGYRLTRDFQAWKNQDGEYLQARAKSIRNAIDKLVDQLNKEGAYTPKQAEFAEDQRRNLEQLLNDRMRSGQSGNLPAINGPMSPAKRLLIKILGAMNPNTLASVAKGQRAVFADMPNQSQFRFGVGIQNFVTQFVREQKLLVDAQANSPKEVQPNNEQRTIIFGDVSSERAKAVQPSKVLLVVNNPTGDSLNIEVLALDQNGETFVRSSIVASSIPVFDATIIKTEKDGEALQIDEETKKFAEFLGQADTGSGDRQVMTLGGNSMIIQRIGSPRSPITSTNIPVEWRQAVANIAARDPLSRIFDTALTQISDLTGKPIVAVIPDSIMLSTAKRILNPINVGQFLASAENDWQLDVESDGSILSIRPAFQSASRAMRAPRGPLATLLRTALQEGRMPLDSAAKYANARVDNPNSNAIEAPLLWIVDSVAARNFRSSVGYNWRALMLFGTLGPSQRQSMAEGSAIPFGRLSPQQGKLCQDIIFNDSGVGGFTMVAATVRMDSNGRPPMNPANTEITEYLPNGLTAESALKMMIQESTAVIAKDENGRLQSFTPEEFAAWSSFGSASGQSGGEFNQFREAKRAQFQIVVQATPDFPATRFLEDSYPVQGSRFAAYEFLSEAFRSAVDRAKKMFSSEAGAGVPLRMGTGGGTPRPPR